MNKKRAGGGMSGRWSSDGPFSTDGAATTVVGVMGALLAAHPLWDGCDSRLDVVAVWPTGLCWVPNVVSETLTRGRRWA